MKVYIPTQHENKNPFGSLLWSLIKNEILEWTIAGDLVVYTKDIFNLILKRTYDHYRIDKHNLIYQEYIKELHEAILKQKYKDRWKPLNKNYLEWKKRNGYDTRIYVQRGDFLKSIGIFRNGDILYIGINENKIHHSGLTYGQLWRILEFGTKKIPPRPLFSIAAQKTIEKFEDENLKMYFKLYPLRLEMNKIKI